MSTDRELRVGLDGFPPGRGCPECGTALEPGFIDDTIALVWLCPTHAAMAVSVSPMEDGEL